MRPEHSLKKSLIKATRTALGKQGAKVAKERREGAIQQSCFASMQHGASMPPGFRTKTARDQILGCADNRSANAKRDDFKNRAPRVGIISALFAAPQ
jgi:hypothetical protein